MFRIAINSLALDGKIPAGDPRWGTFNDNFRNLTLPAEEIVNAIAEGHAYAAWHEGRRKLDNFVLAQHIAIDLDTGDERSSIETLSRNDLVRAYGAVIHTTPSHTKQSPRARIIFLLDKCIETTEAFAGAAMFLIAQFDGADEACKDASRFFYGALNGGMWFSKNVLPLDELRELYRQWCKTHPAITQPDRGYSNDNVQRAYKSTDYADWSDKLLEPVRQAPQGNRNNTLNRQAFLAGKDIAQRRINEAEIIPQLIWAAQTVGLSEVEAQRTVTSGVRSGKAAQ